MICYINRGVEVVTPRLKTIGYEAKRVDDNRLTVFIQANIQQASVIIDFRRIHIVNFRDRASWKAALPFCASSDERRHGNFTVVLARTVKFIWALEEHRDNDRTRFWSVSYSRKKAKRSHVS